MNFTLRDWQKLIKHPKELIVQASTVEEYGEGGDCLTLSSIGMSHEYINFINAPQITQIGDHQNLVLSCFALTTDKKRRPDWNRQHIADSLKSNGILTFTVNPIIYFSSLPHYKFVVSPEGNGIDCHRHYEALLAGCIPIVEDNPIIKEKYGDVPMLFTKDYSEITTSYLESKYEEMIDKVYDFSKLFVNNWPLEEQANIKRRGNYWCQKCKNFKYYQ